MINSNEITGIEFVLEMNSLGVTIIPNESHVKLKLPNGAEFESHGSYEYILKCVEKMLNV
jgi:hypothetical protein